MQKADILTEMSRFHDAAKYLEESIAAGLPLADKLASIRSSISVEYGLPHDHELLHKIERFVRWMGDNDAKFGKIRMKYYAPDYRGVHAHKQINDHEVFLSVPKQLIITPQKGRETEIGALIKASGVRLSWDYLVYITVFLMVQFHDPASWWAPYMDVYPKLVSNFPMFYTEEEKKELQGSPMLKHIDSEIKEIKDEYDQIVAAVPKFKQFTFEEYIRNKTLVISRIFFVKIRGVTERIMVPLAGKGKI